MSNELIKEAALAILEINEYYKMVDNFASKMFNEKYSDENGKIWYNGYDVLNGGNTIRIRYQRCGDVEESGYFDVNL